jgi:polyisoprenoid-binding protein YceI
VLDADHHPQARYRINSALPTGTARPDGSGEYELDGELTVRGATRPLRMTVLVEPVDGKWHLRGQFKIKQTDFGIKPYSKAFHSVADLLVIHGDIWLYR